jgi:hypothetical protein
MESLAYAWQPESAESARLELLLRIVEGQERAADDAGAKQTADELSQQVMEVPGAATGPGPFEPWRSSRPINRSMSLQTGRSLDYLKAGNDRRKLCSLYLSIMDRMGLTLREFGDSRERLTGI